MKIEIWSDFACPYCYIGEKKLEKALEELKLDSPAKVSFRSFQLDVNAVNHPNEDINTLISKKYKISYEQAKQANDGIIATAKEVGLDFDFEILKPSNTGLAHQLIKFAKTKDKETQIAERLFKGYFVEGLELGKMETLIELASLEGFDTKEVESVLKEAVYLKEVLEDQRIAQELGVSSVPFFVIDDKYAVSGAQSVDYFKMAIEKALVAKES